MSDIETVSLGGRSFAVHPLTLGEMRPVLDALDALAGQGTRTSGGALLDAAARIIHAGLARGSPGLSLDDVLALPATIEEVNRAVAAVLRIAGLVPPGEPVAAVPGAAVSATGSPPSTAPSPPAAATAIAPSMP